MKKYLILLSTIALVFTGLFMTPVYAMTLEPSNGFGQHIAMMSPEHPQMYGVIFGGMTSSMARGTSCH